MWDKGMRVVLVSTDDRCYCGCGSLGQCERGGLGQVNGDAVRDVMGFDPRCLCNALCGNLLLAKVERGDYIILPLFIPDVDALIIKVFVAFDVFGDGSRGFRSITFIVRTHIAC